MPMGSLWRDDLYHKFVGMSGSTSMVSRPLMNILLFLRFLTLGVIGTLNLALSTGLPFQDWPDILISLFTNS
jgi:hypothetical protein